MKFLLKILAFLALLHAAMSLKHEICGQPHAVQGSCLAYIPQYTYDAATNQCTDFIYGGCGGNDNQFDTKEQCEELCLE